MTYVIGVFLILVILLSVGGFAVLNSSALYTATIKYKFQNVSNSELIQATEDGAGGFKTLKLTDSDSLTTYTATTGEKVLGEKSSGVLTLFNTTGEIKVIPKGTILTCVSGSCNSLLYTTQADMNIGPYSSANDLRAVANDIGLNYNIATTGAKFKVGALAIESFYALNSQQFTGGTAKQIIKIVSETDLTNLEKRAMDEIKAVLLAKIRNDPQNQSKYIISDSSFAAEKISTEADPVGKEVDTLNLTLRAKGTVDAFDKSQIQTVVDRLKKDLAPDGYFIDDKFFNTSNEVVGTSAGSISVKVQTNATIRPKIDIDQIKKDLAGKSMSDAEKVLENIPNTNGKTFSYSPNMMPEWLRRVPSDPDKIIIRLSAEAA